MQTIFFKIQISLEKLCPRTNATEMRPINRITTFHPAPTDRQVVNGPPVQPKRQEKNQLLAQGIEPPRLARTDLLFTPS